ncbi:MAG TPA: (2Fe-2S) ferredoxin domain-containing protein [Bacteroidales bacterium]|jgi:NADP-reducing hydrogenase subunit HndB|nr:(2Fe-2S) ferredoxin domain-containing protein [Bacteroidales bacterium]
MSRISSVDELNARRSEITSARAGKAVGVQVKVAMATCGIASGAREVMEFFEEQLERRNISASVTPTGCMGYCYAEPTVEIMLPGQKPVVFGYVDLKRADQIIEKYIKTGEYVDGIIPANYETIDLNE